MHSTASHRSIAGVAASADASVGVQSAAAAGIAEPGFLTQAATFYFWRGRVALYILLKSLGIGTGDAVIVQGFTCFAVPSAVLFTGARPLYADIEPANFNLSLDSIRAVCSANRASPVRAIIVQHTFGVPADLNAIVPWARERGIAVIEDCAHVWGSRYRDATGQWRELGTAGDAAFYSSQWTKSVSTGLGGWAVVGNAGLARSVAELYQTECATPTAAASALLAAQVYVRSILSASWIQFSIKAAYQALYRRGLLVGTSTPDELQGWMPVGYSKQMSGFQRRLLAKRLRATALLQHRRHLKSVYDAALAAAGLPTVSVPAFADPVLLRYPVRVNNKRKLLESAERLHIEIGDWYTAPVDRPENLPGSLFAYADGDCPEGERAAREVVNLPMHSRIDERRVGRVVQLLKEIA
jgi:dTDP-4-amino-4,6-dideoxygalactose transaminase